MYGSGGSPDAIARDINSFVHSSTFKSASNGEFAKMKELISSDPYSSYNHHQLNQNQNQNQHQIQRSEFGGQNGSSLMRYRSAPSSFFANLLEELECDDFLAPVNTNTSNHNPEEQIFSGHQQQQPLQKFQSDSPDFLQYASSSSSSMKQQPKEAQIQQLDLSPVSAAVYGNGGSSQLVPPSNSNGVYDHNNNNNNNLVSSSTFGSMNSTSSNLIRQSSSPAGFYSLTSENGKWCSSNDANITRLLRCFYLASGLKVNFAKSKVGVGMHEDKVKNVASLMKCDNVKLPFTYLGVTVGANMGLVRN